ncbi:MAG: ATP-binding cassette domain-containing protein [Rhodobacteraceae bacterium]|nr:ATP-binding cassette domain-containing protein [Paracoccaceae bacterium]
MNREIAVSSNILVKANNIGVKRGNRWIFRDVEFEIVRGKQIFLIGANGSGKTTCAKTVLGLIRPDEGTVARAPSLTIGYIPQKLSFSPVLPLTVRRLLTLTDRARQSEIASALAAVGLERLGNPQVLTLSGGELQRLLLARALIGKPDLLVLDEPAQGVDKAGERMLHERVEEIRRDYGCGALVISHNLELALASGDDFVPLVPHEHDDHPDA